MLYKINGGSLEKLPPQRIGEAQVMVVSSQFTERRLEFTDQWHEMPDEFLNLISKGTSKERVVCDFIACMSDQFATNTFKQLAIPKTWNVM